MISFLLIHLQVLLSFSLACARLSDRVDEREKRASSEVTNEKKWRQDRRGSLLATPTSPATSWKTVSRFKVSNNWRSKSWKKLSQLTNHRVYQAGAGILESGIEKNACMLHYSVSPQLPRNFRSAFSIHFPHYLGARNRLQSVTYWLFK